MSTPNPGASPGHMHTEQPPTERNLNVRNVPPDQSPEPSPGLEPRQGTPDDQELTQRLSTNPDDFE